MDRFDLDSRNPVYDLAYSPKGGSGIVEVPIQLYFCDNHIGEIIKFLAYSWVESVNGIEVDIKKPEVSCATYIDDDIYHAMMQEKRFDHLNFVKL